jgi:ankyrin repeat protein
VVSLVEKERSRLGLNFRPEIEQIILTKDSNLKPLFMRNKLDQIRKIKDAESSQIKDVFQKVHQCNIPVVRDLLHRNLIDVDVRDENGNTLLCTAV